MGDGFQQSNTGSGGAKWSVDEDGSSVNWPYVKMVFGASGTYTHVSTTTPLPVTLGSGNEGAPYVATPLGYQQITSLSSAQTLTVPGGATFCVVSVEIAGVRWRDDGTAPTASIGMPISPGGGLSYSGSLAAIQFIQQGAGAVINVGYYK